MVEEGLYGRNPVSGSNAFRNIPTTVMELCFVKSIAPKEDFVLLSRIECFRLICFHGGILVVTRKSDLFPQKALRFRLGRLWLVFLLLFYKLTIDLEGGESSEE
jgi:hypothetical protein